MKILVAILIVTFFLSGCDDYLNEPLEPSCEGGTVDLRECTY
jgi:PBP1b-binding outer membrane lipoprotein LpoB